MSHYEEGQVHRLANALEMAEFTPHHVTKLGQHPRLEEIRMFLDGEAEIILKPKPELGPRLAPVAPSKPEGNTEFLSLDFFRIVVNRSVKPDRGDYPEAMKRIICPDLECAGPPTYSLQTDIRLWLLGGQETQDVQAGAVLEFLKDKKLLKTCGNLQDGLAIKAKGGPPFQKTFGDKTVFLYGSAIETNEGEILIPYLKGEDNGILIGWSKKTRFLTLTSPALRFI